MIIYPDMTNPYERAIVEGWCGGWITLAEAARSLGVQPEAVVGEARGLGLKPPAGIDRELRQLRGNGYQLVSKRK